MRLVLAFVVVVSIVNFGILIYQVWPEDKSPQTITNPTQPTRSFSGGLITDNTERRTVELERRIRMLEIKIRNVESDIKYPRGR